MFGLIYQSNKVPVHPNDNLNFMRAVGHGAEELLDFFQRRDIRPFDGGVEKGRSENIILKA